MSVTSLEGRQLGGCSICACKEYERSKHYSTFCLPPDELPSSDSTACKKAGCGHGPSSHSVAKENPPLVIDVGSFSTKIGVAGDVQPEFCTPSVLKQSRRDPSLFEAKRHCLDASSDWHEIPIEVGATPWPLIATYWRLCLAATGYRLADRHVLLVLHVDTPRATGDKCCALLAQAHGFASVKYMHPLSLIISSSWTSSLVTAAERSMEYQLIVDCGYHSTLVVPVLDMPDGKRHRVGQVVELAIGGHAIASFLTDTLLAKRAAGTVQFPDAVLDGLCEQVKQFVYVCPDVDKETTKYDAEPDKWAKHVQWFDAESQRRGSVTVENERYLAVEQLFLTLPAAVVQSVESCPAAARPRLYRSIVLAGATSLIKDFAKRLHRDLRRIGCPDDVRVIPPVVRGHASWFGGSMIGSTSEFYTNDLSVSLFDNCQLVDAAPPNFEHRRASVASRTANLSSQLAQPSHAVGRSQPVHAVAAPSRAAGVAGLAAAFERGRGVAPSAGRAQPLDRAASPSAGRVQPVDRAASPPAGRTQPIVRAASPSVGQAIPIDLGRALPVSPSRAMPVAGRGMPVGPGRAMPVAAPASPDLPAGRGGARPPSYLAAGLRQLQLSVAMTAENTLGSGSFGAVFKTQLADGRTAAAKTLFALTSPETYQLFPGTPEYDKVVTEFLNEAQMLASTRHPNIVELLGIVPSGQHTADGSAIPKWIVTELADSTLAKLMSDGPLPLQRARAICIHVLTALSFLHHLPVVHRDLKPANVLLFAGGAVKLCDLGIARYYDRHGAGQQPALMTIGAGTPAYLAPEVVTGVYDQQVDVYSFGIMFVEMVTGQLPDVSLMTRPELRLDFARRQLAPLAADVSPSLTAGVLSALSPSPTLRPTASQLLDTFTSALSSSSSTPLTSATGFDVRAWLASLETPLDQYTTNFLSNGCDTVSVIKTLTDEDLRDALAITIFGHRRLIMMAKQQL